MNQREVAWRVFAEEYNSTTLEHSGEGEKPVSYVVTPLGAKVNRLMVVGVVTDVESIGDEGRPRYRARIADPSGTYYVSAGEYQPSAAMALSKISPPAFAAVVGKSRAYAPESGVKYLSIRPEHVREVDGQARDYWTLETAKSTLYRIDAIEDGLAMTTPSVAELMKKGYPENLSDGVVRAIEYYKDIDLSRFRRTVREALLSMLPEKGKSVPAAAGPGTKPKRPKEKPGETKEEELQEVSVGADEEAAILSIIESLDASGRGAPWDKIVASAKEKKIDKVRLEEIVTKLLDKGEIYEPELGMMKRI